MNEEMFATISLGIDCSKINIPEELEEFLLLDEQGIDGLLFMMKDPKLSRRIPTNVRMQYEILRGELIQLVDEKIKELRQLLDDMEKDKENIIHSAIQAVFDGEDEEFEDDE